jgi:hypothetical protein
MKKKQKIFYDKFKRKITCEKTEQGIVCSIIGISIGPYKDFPSEDDVKKILEDMITEEATINCPELCEQVVAPTEARENRSQVEEMSDDTERIKVLESKLKYLEDLFNRFGKDVQYKDLNPDLKDGA